MAADAAQLDGHAPSLLQRAQPAPALPLLALRGAEVIAVRVAPPLVARVGGVAAGAAPSARRAAVRTQAGSDPAPTEGSRPAHAATRSGIRRSVAIRTCPRWPTDVGTSRPFAFPHAAATSTRPTCRALNPRRETGVRETGLEPARPFGHQWQAVSLSAPSGSVCGGWYVPRPPKSCDRAPGVQRLATAHPLHRSSLDGSADASRGRCRRKSIGPVRQHRAVFLSSAVHRHRSRIACVEHRQIPIPCGMASWVAAWASVAIAPRRLQATRTGDVIRRAARRRCHEREPVTPRRRRIDPTWSAMRDHASANHRNELAASLAGVDPASHGAPLLAPASSASRRGAAASGRGSTPPAA